MSTPWLRIAHRGASGTTPEHTRAAFARAIEIGVDMIELDVQLSRDEHLVVMHDHQLDRTTSGSGLVRNHSLAEIKELDAGGWFSQSFTGERVLDLGDVFELVAGRARLNVEVKSPAGDWEILAPKLLALLARFGVLDSTVVSSFDHGALAAVRRVNPRVPLGVLWFKPELEEAWRWCEDLQASSFHPFWMLANSEVIQTAHAKSLQVLAWTVNDPDAIANLVTAGVDGIISDYPERLMAHDSRPTGASSR